MQIVVFKVCGQEYGFSIEDVKEIVLMQKTTLLPNMPRYIEGITNLRGRIIPVMDLTLKFNLGEQFSCENVGAEGRLIVLNISEEKQVAIKADEVSEILSAEEKEMEQPPEGLAAGVESAVWKVLKYEDRLIMVLDKTKVVAA